MNFYLVGAVEPIFETSFLGKRQYREFSENDFVKNIRFMNNIAFFETRDEAMNYARSLRVQLSSKHFDPKKIQFAPVIDIECEDTTTLGEIKKHSPRTFTASCTEYVDTFTDFGDLAIRYVEVTCRFVPNTGLDFTTFQIKSAEFPDSGRCQQHFAPTQGCALF